MESSTSQRAPRTRADGSVRKFIAVLLAMGVVAAAAPAASAADSIRITDPTDGATIPNTYTARITATDAQRVSKVLARVDSAAYTGAGCTGLGTTSALCSFTLPGTAAPGLHTLAAKTRDSAGNVSTTSIRFNVGSGTVGGVNKVMYAAGDIACAPGNPGNDTCMDAQTNALIGNDADVIGLLGDIQYEGGSLSDFNASFHKTWGNHPGSLLNPSPGNHEYRNSTASGYFDYFQNAGQSARTDSVEVGARTEGWHAETVGDWKVINLNSGDTCGKIDGAGPSCAEGSPQDNWLEAQIQNAPADQCLLAVWHHPPFTNDAKASYARNSVVDPMWNSLTDPTGGGPADLLLVGHSHAYERFAKRGPAPGFAPSSAGVREFLVGSGGKNVEGGFGNGPVPHEASSLSFGVLKLTLKDDSYDYAFKATGGATPDSGSGACNT